MFLIFYGYCLMIYTLAIFIFAGMMCMVHRHYSTRISQNESDLHHRNLGYIPILSTMETYRVRRYELRNRNSRRSQQYSQPLNQIDSSVCSLCGENFKTDDTVLDCHSGHVFHVKCFEQDRVHHQHNACPICGESMYT